MEIIITESAKKRLFKEAASIERERGIAARAFLKALKNALKNGEYQYDSDSMKITFDNYEYKRGSEYAYLMPLDDIENEKTPIDLHFTKNTVNKHLDQELGNDEDFYFN